MSERRVRTDVHRSSTIVTEDYEFVGCGSYPTAHSPGWSPLNQGGMGFLVHDEGWRFGPRLANGGFANPKVNNIDVTFTANVTRSGDDESFGFFSRPRKASVIGETA